MWLSICVFVYLFTFVPWKNYSLSNPMKKLRCYFELTLLLVAHFMVPIQFRIDLSSNITLLIIVQDMKYLLGPVSSEADLRWCPDPRRTDYTRPLIDLAIDMRELRNVDGDITLCLGIYF